MSKQFFDYFRCPLDAARFDVSGEIPGEPGYFRFAESITCYGKSSAVPVARHWSDHLGETLPAVCISDGKVRLPFEPDQIAANLRYERYAGSDYEGSARLTGHSKVRNIYYLCRPLLPVSARSILQRIRLRGRLNTLFPQWPLDRTVDIFFEKLMELALKANNNVPIPFIWFWPEGANAAFIMTHDVETAAGVAFCPRLMDLDSKFGFRSSFQLVPEKRYEVTDSFLQEIKSRGFEVNVHDLNHDGNLFREREEFRRRAEKINHYAVRFGTRGFRSGALYHHLDWYDAFDISYDMSVPNVGHLDPQGGGCCTIMPFFVRDIVEIPVTATQDYSLFHILNQYSLDLWKRQIEIIVKGKGIVSLITHPDYLIAKRPRNTYQELLAYLADICKANQIWATLPAEIDRWWRIRRYLKLIRIDQSWQIQGEGSGRARIAYARLIDGQVRYTFDPPSSEDQRAHFRTMEDTLGPPIFLGRVESTSGSAQLSRTALHDEGMLQTIVSREQFELKNLHHNELGKQMTSGTVAVRAVAQTREKSRRRLRICMVAYTFYETDNRVMRYAETLAQEGHEVEVFALRKQDNSKQEVLYGVKVYRLQHRPQSEKTQFSYVRRVLLFLIRSFYEVSKSQLKRKYDLVHVHSVPDFLVFSALVPRVTGTPVVLDIHDILPEFYAGKFGANKNSFVFRLMCYTEWICSKFASHVIIANHIWKDRLESRSVEATKCSVVMNYPDRSIFQPSHERPAKSDRFVILYPGTLNWHQGLDIAVRAFAKISAQVPYADFHIYGEGPLKEHLVALIRSLGLEGRVVLFESKPLREIAQVMETADLGIVPKRKDSFGNEAFSTKILEFMAMDVPVIISDTAVDRYYFNDSLVRFFRGGDEDDLARCMLDLIQHPEKRRALVENANDFIAKNDWAFKKHEYLDLVDRLTDRSKH